MEEFKTQLKDLKVKLKAAEKRAVIAEKMVKVFSKELDAREGTFYYTPFLYYTLSSDHLRFPIFTAVFLFPRLSIQRKGEVQIHLRRHGLYVR